MLVHWAKMQSRVELVHDKVREGEKSTLTQAVYEQLKEDLFEFRMAPSQRYSEQEISTRLGVSRTPLRLALYRLAQEGYLERTGNYGGWLVPPFDLAYYEDLYDFRTQIELIAVQRLCAISVMPDLSALSQFWLCPKRLRNMDGSVVASQDEKLHSAFVQLAGNKEMLRAHTDLTERIRIIRRLDFIEPARITAAYEEHGAILKALLARKASQARTLIETHIGASRAEIRHITLHRLSLAAERGERAKQA